MKTIKIAAAVACGLTILLLVLTFTVENPELALYEETVQKLMAQEGINCDQEIKRRFPILLGIEKKMDRMANLKQLVLDKTRSPAPIITEKEVLQLEYYKKKINQLRKDVIMELSQLTATYVIDQP
ncbi:MAG: hypothetical protein AAGG68_17305 [Bacteroidota bacterium]